MNHKNDVASLDADTLDHDCQRAHLLLLEDVKRGMADIAAGRTFEADATIAATQHRRRASAVMHSGDLPSPNGMSGPDER
jgi:hypothetical protein